MTQCLTDSAGVFKKTDGTKKEIDLLSLYHMVHYACDWNTSVKEKHGNKSTYSGFVYIDVAILHAEIIQDHFTLYLH